MNQYEITDDMLSRDVLHADDLKLLPEDMRGSATNPGGYFELESVTPKYKSVGALIAWVWSLDTGQDEDAGDAQYGNGWNALFRSERLILNEDNDAYLRAYRITEGQDVDEAWAEIEKGAVYPDQCNNPDCEDLSCENFDCGQGI